MIVVDNTVLVDFWVGEPEQRDRARKLLMLDSEWLAPDLWRYEFGNVILKYARLGYITGEAKEQAWKGCLRMVKTIHEIDVLGVDELARRNDLKFYDASYVWLARDGDMKFFTRDSLILRTCPDVACEMPELK